MQEVMFIVEDANEGGYIAKGVDVSIFTEAETFNQLKEMLKDAVRCHFEDSEPGTIQLQYSV